MNIKMLLNGALGRKVPAEFAAENYDYEQALRDELKKIAGDSRYSFERNKIDIFELLTSDLEEVLPNQLRDALGMFAEVVHIPQGSRLSFRVKKGKQRGKQFVTRATESGVYETFRLDHESFDMYPHTYGAGGIVDFERYLDGIEDMADIYEVIREGFVEAMFKEVQACLLESWNAAGRPARNKVAANAFDVQEMRNLCNTIAAYGAPVIYCAPQFAAEMTNVIIYDTTVKISDQDMIDVRERGYIGKFYGTPVVVLPQSFEDESNEKAIMNPCFAYVMPAGKEKLVKIGIEGAPYFREWDNRDNGMELQAYQKLGVAMVNTPNYWGIYYNAGIDAMGWEEYNEKLVG